MSATVKFNPGEKGTYRGNLYVTNYNGRSIWASVPVTVNVVTEAREIGLSGDLAFGGVDVNSTKYRTLTITNSGYETLHVTDVQLPPAFTASQTTLEIPAGKSQNIDIMLGNCFPGEGR